MKAVAIIPARFASTRCPGKLLLRATGKYLIQHVWERVCAARNVSRVLVATDDERIAHAVREFGGEAVMTDPRHTSGTDRVAEVARGLDERLLLNVQGDEPEVSPMALDECVGAMESVPPPPMATLAYECHDEAEVRNPANVKVVVDTKGFALYFSRSVIPGSKEGRGPGASGQTAWAFLIHTGVYAYTRECLMQLSATPPSPLERREGLEQLRALENGYGIKVVMTGFRSRGIDTPAQYEEFVRSYKAGLSPASE